MDFYEEITNELKSGRIRNKMELQKEKVKLSKNLILMLFQAMLKF